MTRTQFFMVTAVMEVGAGLALLAAPALVVRLLFGSSEIQTGVAMGRLAGAALVSLGTACWWARHDSGGPASRGLVSGLLVYNAAVIALVLSATFGSLGPLLWAVVVVHGAMAVWCVGSLRAGR
jgi:Mg/Co/Ni transporter MgtE